MSDTVSLGAARSDKSFWWWAGLMFTPVRLVAGFMFLSAFIRRVIQVPAKMDPTSAQYLGHKFSGFLPHAIVIKPLIARLIQNPELLHPFLWFFTIMEGVVGLFLIVGFVTRLTALGSALLSAGILLGSGWLGSTCLDEWQIGALLVAAGLAVAVSGSGPFSVDNWLLNRSERLAQSSLFRWLFSGSLPVMSTRKLAVIVLTVTVLAGGTTLYTYQALHNGLWGKLHNDSKAPHLTISQVVVNSNGSLHLDIYRDGGPDTYGSFIEEVRLTGQDGQVLADFDASYLSHLGAHDIENHMIYEKVKAGPYGLIVPLAASATIHLTPAQSLSLPAGATVKVTIYDVSGASWSASATIP